MTNMKEIITAQKKRMATVKYIVPNLRARWKEELRPYTDNQVAALYEDFSLSGDFGNNDEKFPECFDMLPNYPVAWDEAKVGP